MKHTPALVAALAGILVLGTPALAQRKPDPKPSAPGAKREGRIADNEAKFLQAYDRAGAPRLYIYSHLRSLAADEAEMMDDEVILHHFHARFWDHFADPDVDLVNAQETRIRDAAVRAAFDDNNLQRASELLGQEVEAGLVIVVKIQELQRRADGAEYSCTYWINNRTRGETIGSHSWFMYPDKKALSGEFTAKRIGDYAAAAAERAMGDITRAFPGGARGEARKFTLQFTGIPSRQFREVRDALENIDGIERVYRPKFRKGLGQTLATLDVKYDGDPLDLAIDTTLAVEETIDMVAEFNSAGEGTIVFAVEPMPVVTLESMLSGGAVSAENQQIRDRLARAYNGEGRPRIGVMVNKLNQAQAPMAGELIAAHQDAKAARDFIEEAVDELEDSGAIDPATGDTATGDPATGDTTEEGDPATDAGTSAAAAPAGGNQTQTQTLSVVMQPRISIIVGDVRDADEDDAIGDEQDVEIEEEPDPDDVAAKEAAARLNALDTLMMEQSLLTRFSQLGLTCVDLAQAQLLLEKDKKIVGQIHDQTELVRLLGLQADVAVMVAGAGWVERTPDGQARLVYTFSAYNVEDATYLGGVNARRDVAGFMDTGAASEELAAEVTGKLAVQMLNRWEPPQTLQVRVSNCHSPRELQAIRNLIRDRIPGVVRTIHRGFLPGAEDGLGIFEIVYTTSYDELTNEIYRGKDLPFDLDGVLSTRERLNIRITETLD